MCLIWTNDWPVISNDNEKYECIICRAMRLKGAADDTNKSAKEPTKKITKRPKKRKRVSKYGCKINKSVLLRVMV